MLLQRYCSPLLPTPPALCSDIVPLGQVKSNFNYSTVDKRVLNMENVVNDDDNIKQVRGAVGGGGGAWRRGGAERDLAAAGSPYCNVLSNLAAMHLVRQSCDHARACV